MVLSISVKREYVPKAFGNDKAPVAEQIKVEHFAPTIAIKEKLFPKTFEYDKNGEVKGTFEIDRPSVIRAFVKNISNLSYQTGEEGNVAYKVRTADDLLKGPSELEELVDELYSYFQELLNAKVEEKN